MRLKCLHPVILINPVSIHASVKDATRRLKNNCKSNLRFNPRICKRCDTVFKSLPDSKACFNPRICKRCDTVFKSLPDSKACFNPRICKRCDIIGIRYIKRIKVSIHASVKDATVRDFCYTFSLFVSIHASVKDATVMVRFLSFVMRFQSTHL